MLERIERIIEHSIAELRNKDNNKTVMESAEKELNYWRHFAIKGVSEDAEKTSI